MQLAAAVLVRSPCGAAWTCPSSSSTRTEQRAFSTCFVHGAQEMQAGWLLNARGWKNEGVLEHMQSGSCWRESLSYETCLAFRGLTDDPTASWCLLPVPVTPALILCPLCQVFPWPPYNYLADSKARSFAVQRVTQFSQPGQASDHGAALQSTDWTACTHKLRACKAAAGLG